MKYILFVLITYSSNKQTIMDYSHCDDYEQFLYELAFGENDSILHELYLQAVDQVQPDALNLSHDEELHQTMDDCWDSEWINPLTGIPHYVAANLPLTGTTLKPPIDPPQYYITTPPKHSKQKLCTFCANKYGYHNPRCKTHTVKQCRLLANTSCLNCGEKGHTVSHCSTKHIIINMPKKPHAISILDKAGGLPTTG